VAHLQGYTSDADPSEENQDLNARKRLFALALRCTRDQGRGFGLTLVAIIIMDASQVIS